jgi:hypothetical protein
MWKAVCSKYQDKSALAQSDMHTSIAAMHCKENGNLRAHLDLMCEKRNDLMQAGVKFMDKEFLSWIISLLPRYYATYISNLTSAAKLVKCQLGATTSLYPPVTGTKSSTSESPKKPILTSDDITHFLEQEYDVQSCDTSSNSTKAKDVALAADGSKPGAPGHGNSNRNGGKPSKMPRQPAAGAQKSGEAPAGDQKACWRHGGTGHRCNQCLSPPTLEEAKKKSSKYKGLLKPLDSANAVTEGDNGFNAFTAIAGGYGSEDEDEGPFEVPDAYADDGWFSNGNEDNPVGHGGLAAAAMDLPATVRTLEGLSRLGCLGCTIEA